MRSLPYTSGADQVNTSRQLDNNSNSLTRQGELSSSHINQSTYIKSISHFHLLINVYQLVVLLRQKPQLTTKMQLVAVNNLLCHLVINILIWQPNLQTMRCTSTVQTVKMTTILNIYIELQLPTIITLVICINHIRGLHHMVRTLLKSL